MHAVTPNVRDRAAVAVGVDRRELDGLRVPAQRLKVSPRHLRVRLRALRRIDLGEANDRLDVAVLNGERVAVGDSDDNALAAAMAMTEESIGLGWLRGFWAIVKMVFHRLLESL